MTKGILRAPKERKVDVKKKVKQKEKEKKEVYLVSPSSSLSTTTYSTTSSESQQSEEEYKSMHVLSEIFFSDESFSEEGSEYELPSEPFTDHIKSLEDLISIPDIDVISENVSVASIKPVIPVTVEDKGQFVDPVTGMQIQEETKPASFVSEPSVKETSSEEEEFDMDFQMSDLSFGVPKEKSSESEDLEVISDDIFEALLKLEETEVVVEAEDNYFDILAREQEARELRQQTLKFLDDLVHNVITNSEIRGAEIALRENLDKHKLISHLFEANVQYVDEKSKCIFLNRKVVDYHKRKKLFRDITEENQKDMLDQKNKYFRALKNLDEQMVKLENIKNSHENSVTKLLSELKISQTKTKNQQLQLEDVVKKTICRDEWPQLNQLVEGLLNTIEKEHKDISDVRYQMIIHQHTHGELLKKHARIEDIGEGLTIKLYNHIATENLALDKKIYERSVEFRKLHVHMESDLHLLAHYREKQSILRDLVTSKTSILNELKEELTCRRKYLYRLKLKHNAIRQEIKKLNVDGSLINKPALLYDYDKTMEYINEKREIVNILRLTFDTTSKRLSRLEQRLSNNNNNNYLSSVA